MASRACLCVGLILICSTLDRDIFPELFVWNVGQGQWVTILDERGCWHFDVGGERAPWTRIAEVCRARPNFLWISHMDWDHISFAGGMRRFLPNVCLLAPVSAASANKLRLFTRIPACASSAQFAHWNGAHEGPTNAQSRVVYERGVLIPGDSPRDQEKIWIRELGGIERTRVLILGHHGSRTSTSIALMRKLPRLRVAIASARHRRYGHPHAEVEARVRAARVPLLRTEDWGNIRMRL